MSSIPSQFPSKNDGPGSQKCLHASAAKGQQVDGGLFSAGNGPLMSTVENILRFQATALEMIATGRPLVSVLDAISRYVEQQAEDIRCSITIIDAEHRIRPASAPSLPFKYSGDLDDVLVYPCVAPCGLAAHQKQPVISESIELDERWSDGFRSMTKSFGLKACWSTPICDAGGTVIATLAIYSLHPGTPSAHHHQLIGVATRLAGIAIERHLREERLRLCAEIISRSADAIRILDPSWKIIEQNAAHRELFGIPDELLLGNTPAIIFGDEQFQRQINSVGAEKAFHGDLTAEIMGEQHIIDVTVFPVHREGGKILCFASLSRDVTATRKTQEEMEKSHAELETAVEARTSQLQNLTARLMTTQDEERRHIARELHDSAGQYLAAIQMNLSAMRNSPEMTSTEKSRIQDSWNMAVRCSSEIRTISYLLHPPLLDEMGLRSAILSYVEGFAQRSGIRVDLDIPDGLRRLPAEIETTIFRVVQQGLSNIHRHSESRVAGIRLAEDNKQIKMVIRDDGRGIPAEKLNHFKSGRQLIGVGIAGMRERIRDMHGEFDIRSGASGTTIEVNLPVFQRLNTQDAKAKVATA
jgi:PAS domain S-box-containing protein